MTSKMTLPKTMHAAVIKDYGGVDQFEYRTDVPIPQITKPSQVLVKLSWAAVNPADYKFRNGSFKYILPFPPILGKDGCGVVVKVGKDVKRFQIGDTVMGCTDSHGTYAQYYVFEEEELIKKPDELPMDVAASLPIVSLTIWKCFKTFGKIKKGQKILITGGSGGCGQVAVQLAAYYGLYTYATCSTKNVEFVKSLKANRVIDYTKEDFEEVLKKEGTMLDYVIDTVGGSDITKKAISCIKSEGTFCTIAAPEEFTFGVFLGTISSMLWNKIKSIFFGPKFYFIFVSADHKSLEEVVDLYAKGKLKNKILQENIFELKDIAEAHKKSESRRTVGKIVIKIPE